MKPAPEEFIFGMLLVALIDHGYSQAHYECLYVEENLRRKMIYIDKVNTADAWNNPTQLAEDLGSRGKIDHLHLTHKDRRVNLLMLIRYHHDHASATLRGWQNLSNYVVWQLSVV